MKTVSLSLMVALSSGLFLGGCNKAGRPAVKGKANPVLTKEKWRR
jgi:hypothetical protein